MCLLVLVHGVAAAGARLVVAANRDEYHARPAAPAAFWPGSPDVLAGRDLEAGGTWLGVTRSGRFAALTNIRDPRAHRPGRASRGGLVAGFLLGQEPADAYAKSVLAAAAGYNGFNLVVGDEAGALWYVENRTPAARALPPGVHGLSNHLLDTPWPKVTRTKTAIAAVLGPDVVAEELLAPLADRTRPPDAELPDTGVGLEVERLLSSPFIVSPAYGTRCSTALVVGSRGTLLVERSFDPEGRESGVARFAWEQTALREG